MYSNGLDIVCLQSNNIDKDRVTSKRKKKVEKIFDSIEAYAASIDLISEVT